MFFYVFHLQINVFNIYGTNDLAISSPRLNSQTARPPKTLISREMKRRTGTRVVLAEVGRLFEINEIASRRLLVRAIGDDQSVGVLCDLDARRAVVTASQTGRDQSKLLNGQPAGARAASSTHAVTFALQLHLTTHRLQHIYRS